MEREHRITFGPFCLELEVTHGRLWRGEQIIALRPRSLAVLRYLVEHAGRLVTKAELRQQVWTRTHVTDTVLRVCVRDIRAALGDEAAAPQYVETVGQQGYRFLVQGDGNVSPPVIARPIVGRQREVDTLEGWFQRAARGERQVVFLSGDAGVGKTTVLDLWLARLVAGGAVRSGRGQCTEHYGEAEPYLPLLDALGRLGHGPHGHEIVTVLRRYAPMWLVQLPGLISDAELERVQHQVQGATRARMIRELAEALERLTADTPLVLVLEDLHWSDLSTVECLAALAQRREPARLLVLGTYRPVETVLRAHPLRGLVQELRGRGQAVDLRLEFLPAEDVTAYIAGRLGGPVAAPLAAFVHARTDGNALFMVNLVEHLVQQGLVGRQAGQWTLRDGAAVHELPEGLRQVLLRRIEALAPAVRRVLEAASVMGDTFAVAAVAAGLEESVAEVEAICDALAAQEHVITDTGLSVWPDGTRGGSYRFRHVLYQQVLYEQLGATRRVQLHGRIGTRLAAGYGGQAGDIAATLALHAERGGEPQQAVHYLQQAGEQAARRHADHEAVAYLTKGLTVLATLPDSPERTHHELTLLLILGERLMATKGMGAPEVGEVYTRAHTLCHQMEEPLQLFQALHGLYRFRGTRGQLHIASELSQQLFQLAHCQHDTVLLREGHMAKGSVAFYRSEFVTARAHMEQGLHLCDTHLPPTPLFSGGHDRRVMTLAGLTQVLWALGYADQAQQRGQEALAQAQQAGHPPSLVYAELYAAILSQYCRDVAAVQAHADAMMVLATAQDLGHRIEHGRILWGWALAMQDDAATGVAHIQQGLVAVQSMGLKLYRPYFLALLAEAYGQAGQPEAGLTVLAEALTLVATTEERWWEAELYRLRGELLLHAECRVRHTEWTPAECFRQAIEVARRQQARSLELRAALHLSRLWRQQGKGDNALQLLVEIFGWFTEGFATPDLQEAQELLGALTGELPNIPRAIGAQWTIARRQIVPA
jgi:predicted ATPase/DNA-binding winged helix-turn-helix (wHTH) protein